MPKFVDYLIKFYFDHLNPLDDMEVEKSHDHNDPNHKKLFLHHIWKSNINIIKSQAIMTFFLKKAKTYIKTNSKKCIIHLIIRIIILFYWILARTQNGERYSLPSI